MSYRGQIKQRRNTRPIPLAIALISPPFFAPATRAANRFLLPTSLATADTGLDDNGDTSITEHHDHENNLNNNVENDDNKQPDMKSIIPTPIPTPTPTPPPLQQQLLQLQPQPQLKLGVESPNPPPLQLPQTQKKTPVQQQQAEKPKQSAFRTALQNQSGEEIQVSPQVGVGVSVGCFAGAGYGLAVGMGSVAATSVARNTALVVPFGKAQLFAHDGGMVGAFCGVVIGGGFASGVGAHFGYRFTLFDDWIQFLRKQVSHFRHR